MRLRTREAGSIAISEGVLKAGGGDYFDIMNFHSFPTLGGN